MEECYMRENANHEEKSLTEICRKLTRLGYCDECTCDYCPIMKALNNIRETKKEDLEEC